MILSYLINHPSFVFDIDGINIEDSDFSTSLSRNLYRAIKSIASEPGSIDQEVPLDPILIEEHVASEWPAEYKNNTDKYSESIKYLAADTISSDQSKGTIKKHIRAVVSESYKSKINRQLGVIERSVNEMSNAPEMVETVEKSIYDFTSNLFVGHDILHIGSVYESYMSGLAMDAENGLIETGVSTGYLHYDEAIGGGLRRGTVNIIAARPKCFKSLLALSIANNVSKQQIPVLYLDTELSEELQMARTTSIETGIPLHLVESGEFIRNQSACDKIKQLGLDLKERPFDYIQIAGWPLSKQVSIIRKWFTKRVGKRPDGKWNNALVILDYLKLMSAKDKGGDKEYEALGFHISKLHDLMRDYDNPMLALAQQNRSGVDTEDATTISGSDRIIWLCDNFSILSKQSDTDVGQSLEHLRDNPEFEDQFSNVRLNVVECRHGPGCRNGEFIGLYIDFRDPRKESAQCNGRIIEIGLKMPAEDNHGH